MTSSPTFRRIPRHVGLIPDGNRRWARALGRHPAEGYIAGMECGLTMLDDCIGLGIEEVSVYGFTTDNTKRPRDQRVAFAQACVAFVEATQGRAISLRVVGDTTSHVFPEALRPYATSRIGPGPLKVNLLVNYGWQWDLQSAVRAGEAGPISDHLASRDVSRIDLIVRWGGMRRLSGFLPVQSVYADFFVVEEMWPDYQAEQFLEALRWYEKQDVTLGG